MEIVRRNVRLPLRREIEWQERSGEELRGQASCSTLPPLSPTGFRGEEAVPSRSTPLLRKLDSGKGAGRKSGRHPSLPPTPQGREIDAECLVRVGVGSQQGLSPAYR